MASPRISSVVRTALILAALGATGLAGCGNGNRRKASRDPGVPAKPSSNAASVAPRERPVADPNAGLVPYGEPFDRTAEAPPTQTSGPRDVSLRPGDVVNVKFFYTPELDVTQSVRPDGKIALQLVGEVPVEGKTPSQVRDLLLLLYDTHLKDPRITIVLQSQYDRRIFVGGEVVRPGVISMPGDMTVTEAIMEAGGFDMDDARVDNVLVLRQTGGRWQGFKMNLKSFMAGDATEPFYLHPRDIVYVPRTKIAQVNQWIEQHINRLIPKLPFYFSIPDDN